MDVRVFYEIGKGKYLRGGVSTRSRSSFTVSSVHKEASRLTFANERTKVGLLAATIGTAVHPLWTIVCSPWWTCGTIGGDIIILWPTEGFFTIKVKEKT